MSGSSLHVRGRSVWEKGETEMRDVRRSKACLQRREGKDRVKAPSEEDRGEGIIV